MPRAAGSSWRRSSQQLDRGEEAHQELERLRAAGAPRGEIDRRLALLAYNSGDLQEAQQRFTDLLTSGEADDAAQLYLADIAARDGDPDARARRLPAAVRFLAGARGALARGGAAARLASRAARRSRCSMTMRAEHPEESSI